MDDYESKIEDSLLLLQNKVKEVIDFYQQELDFDKMVYPFWTAKDVLGHLTFWHESFARNLNDLSDGKKPIPLSGKLSEVNQRSVDSTRSISIPALLDRLSNAQKGINNCIGDTSISSIPYKKGSRNYSRLEHLEVVSGHIKKHLKDLRKTSN